ncbi:helix-turn-helix domain-containing protein [Clostridium ihumii]|uniref:helix-turn-helix domain-containing protein n=1 Tax=Clostridium ihumii TaxID=1470356 RepID=UPI00054F5A73|nr:helix-turn-helix transcriptional regulator [Clostridium ihumii]
MDSFGKRLKKLRLNLKLTQEQLGKVFSVTNVGIAKWESNDRFPDKDTLVKIADYFNVSIDYLLCRTDNPNAKIYTGDLNGDKVEIEVNKDYPHELTPDEVKELIDNLNEVGFDVDKLIEKVKNKDNKKD